MSGVFGVIDAGATTAVRPLVSRMGGALAQRSWDLVNTYCDDGGGIGRVASGLFNREPQPRQSDDGRIVVCFSGELYDTTPLRRQAERAGFPLRDTTDVELVLRLYQSLGAGFGRHLSGAFVAAVWDRASRRLLLTNDRFGFYPVYYAHQHHRFVFAPRMQAVLCDPDLRQQLDLTALAEYLRFQHLLGDKTFFTGLALLPNAAQLQYDVADDQVCVETYWDAGGVPELPHAASLAEAAEETGRRLDAAVRQRAVGGARLGVYLSGGVDARAILGFLRRYVSPITTITYGLPSRDTVYAARLARRAGTRHHYFPFADGTWVPAYADLHLSLTEGSHSWIHAHGISVSAAARELIDVNFSGYGGGERSSDWGPALLQVPDDGAFCALLFQTLIQRATWPGLDEAEEALLFDTPFARPLRGRAFESLRHELRGYTQLPYARRALAFAVNNGDRRLYMNSLVFNRSHVEQRVPFCDYGYVDFVFALPAAMLRDRRLRRAVLERYMPDLAAVPYDHDQLPAVLSAPRRTAMKLAQRCKAWVNQHVHPVFAEHATLYADYEAWMRHELRDWSYDLLLGPRTRQRGMFNAQFVESLWRRQQSGAEPNVIGKLAPLMTWELFLRRFCDASGGET